MVLTQWIILTLNVHLKQDLLSKCHQYKAVVVWHNTLSRKVNPPCRNEMTSTISKLIPEVFELRYLSDNTNSICNVSSNEHFRCASSLYHLLHVDQMGNCWKLNLYVSSVLVCSLSRIVGPLGLSLGEISTDLNNLVRTFRLEHHTQPAIHDDICHCDFCGLYCVNSHSSAIFCYSSAKFNIFLLPVASFVVFYAFCPFFTCFLQISSVFCVSSYFFSWIELFCGA